MSDPILSTVIMEQTRAMQEMEIERLDLRLRELEFQADGLEADIHYIGELIHIENGLGEVERNERLLATFYSRLRRKQAKQAAVRDLISFTYRIRAKLEDRMVRREQEHPTMKPNLKGVDYLE